MRYSPTKCKAAANPAELRQSSVKKSTSKKSIPKKSIPDNPNHDKSIQEVDAMFRIAGLARNLRGKSPGVNRPSRSARVDPEELSRPGPVPAVASNGVNVLKIPAWDKWGSGKASWLWHGFSTRKGGLSRAYCAADAP